MNSGHYGSPSLSALADAFDLSDHDIEDHADRLAAQVRKLREVWRSGGATELAAAEGLQRIARRHRVKLPTKPAIEAQFNRMTEPSWWRRSLRHRLCFVELQAIRSGAVHRRVSPYVSAKALRRHERNVKRLADLVAGMEAMNLTTGEVLPMDKVVERSQANPANRRMAMMARIRGIEAHAKARGDVAVFLTITTPSRMHARYESGAPVPTYAGTSPRQAHAHLHGVWRRASRAADRQGLVRYGLRTVEPHHDGCPHWHVLMFARPGDVDALLQVFRAHALEDSPNEPGAAERRFVVERIDPAKGGAASYVAKYVAKSIDGEGIDSDTESDGDGRSTAGRVVAWARTWRIRQFQFFGLPPITPNRELYRAAPDGIASEGLRQAHAACKANDYGAFLEACEAYAVQLSTTYRERPSARYMGETTRNVHGLVASAIDLAEPLQLDTRTEQWVIQPRGGERDRDDIAPTWTRINNCARPYESTGCDAAGSPRTRINEAPATRRVEASPC